jgi:two-component system response regulator NreC
VQEGRSQFTAGLGVPGCFYRRPWDTRMPVKILLADHREIVRQGLKALLDEKSGFQVIGEAPDGYEAIRLAKKFRPEVAILNLMMPHVNGLNAAREILYDAPGTKVVLLTTETEERHVLDALRAGITGYVLRTEAVAELAQALNEVCCGSTYLSPKVSRAILQAYLARTPMGSGELTDRERRVLQFIAEGLTPDEIARLLAISLKTAEAHRIRIMSKLETHGTTGLVRYAIWRGFLRP